MVWVGVMGRRLRFLKLVLCRMSLGGSTFCCLTRFSLYDLVSHVQVSDLRGHCPDLVGHVF